MITISLSFPLILVSPTTSPSQTLPNFKIIFNFYSLLILNYKKKKKSTHNIFYLQTYIIIINDINNVWPNTIITTKIPNLKFKKL